MRGTNICGSQPVTIGSGVLVEDLVALCTASGIAFLQPVKKDLIRHIANSFSKRASMYVIRYGERTDYPYVDALEIH